MSSMENLASAHERGAAQEIDAAEHYRAFAYGGAIYFARPGEEVMMCPNFMGPPVPTLPTAQGGTLTKCATGPALQGGEG